MRPNGPVMRVWAGCTTAADADEYARYLLQTGLPGYRAVPGNLGARFGRRDVGERTEFRLISFWVSMDAVRAFAGDEPERAVFYSEDERFLVERDLVVSHYEVFAEL